MQLQGDPRPPDSVPDFPHGAHRAPAQSPRAVRRALMPQVWQSGKGAEWPPGGTEPRLGTPGVTTCLGPAAPWDGLQGGAWMSPHGHTGGILANCSDRYSSLWRTRVQSATLGPCPRPWAGPFALRAADTPAAHTPDNAGAQAQSPGVSGSPCALSLEAVLRTPELTRTARTWGGHGVQGAHLHWAPG